MLKFRPELIITDFEPFSCYLSLLFFKKCISIDNQHIIDTKLEIKDHRLNRFLTRFAIHAAIPKADYYLVTTFFYPEIIKNNAFLFPPINRKAIINIKPKEKDYILVYQTSSSNKKLAPELNSVNHKFIIYGFDKKEKIKNLEFRKFDNAQFVKDLANCKALICNGGFTTIGEALYLGKPILSIPVKRQFEQIINANYLDKLGYGKYCREINKKNVEEFISNIPNYKKNLKKYKKEDNSKIIKKLNSLISHKG